MDMPEKIAAWRFDPTKADEWIHGGWSEDHDHKTTEYTRSDLAVEVKPLVWSHHPLGKIASDNVGGAYIIDLRGKGPWFAKWPHGHAPEVETLDAAKAAAQADYNARILSALNTRPDDLRPKLQALVTKWEGMTCRTKCAEELREVLEGGG